MLSDDLEGLAAAVIACFGTGDDACSIARVLRDSAEKARTLEGAEVPRRLRGFEPAREGNVVSIDHARRQQFVSLLAQPESDHD